MHETPEDLAELQRRLDESHATAGEHLRSMPAFRPHVRAKDVTAKLKGVFMINLATVTARSEPIVAPVDGLFYRGNVWFSLPPGAQRATHLHARPQVSATYVEGDPGACLIVHGTARSIGPDNPFSDGFGEFVREIYGVAIDFAKKQYGDRTRPEFTGYIEPRRIFALGFPRAD